MKVYVSGPMKGFSWENCVARFQAAKDEVTALGHEAVSPADIQDESFSYQDYMRADLKLLLDCDVIYMMRGWDESKGAMIEYEVARVCGMTILFQRAMPQ